MIAPRDDMINVLLAAVSSVPSFLTALAGDGLITIISAIVLPIVFFTVGKTADILLRIYFKRRDDRRSLGEKTANED